MGSDCKIVAIPCKVDLHIHSAASTKTKDAGNADLATCDQSKVDGLVDKLNQCGVNICAITDHDCFDLDLYRVMKEKERRGSLHKVLPGVEFSVSFQSDAEDKGRSVIHIVAVFEDEDPELLAKLPSVICDSDGNPRYDDAENSAFTEKGFTEILRNSGLNAILIGHEKSAGQEGKRDVSSLGMEKADEVVLTEFVDAIEIGNRRKELDVKRLVSTYKRDGVPFVLGSDCHNWDVYPQHDKHSLTQVDEMAFSSIKCLPSFRGLLMAVTDSSRIKVGEVAFFNSGAPKLDGMDVSVDGQSYHVPLSPGINAIIGDNSIGKSMLIHALTGYRHLGGNPQLRQGYQDYCAREKLVVEPLISDAMEFRFDDQDSVKKVLEELHTGAGAGDYFAKYYQEHVDIDGVRAALKRFIFECLKAMESKTAFNDALERLRANEIELKVLPRSEKLSIVGSLKKVSFEEIDQLISRIKQEIEAVQNIRADHEGLLFQIGSDADKALAAAIKELERVHDLAVKHRHAYKLENVKKSALDEAVKSEKSRLKDRKTDEQRAADSYQQALAAASEAIAEVAKLRRNRKNKAFVFASDLQMRVPNYMGRFVFVSEVDPDPTKSAYCSGLVGTVFNKPEVDSIIKAIEAHTEIGIREVSQAVTGEKPQLTKCYTEIRKKFDELIDGIDEKRKITNEEIGLEGEPSPGLYGRLYFELLAEDDADFGMYIVDQPEDQISQMAIKERVLDAFKRMSANRQILMITHNPQFVVNLDVDNVIAFERDGDTGKIAVKSGALEYEGDDYSILDIVANTVEGGADVVRKRLKRYGSERN